ncbi:MAG: methionyl-tRNA formyltransferase [Opitutaceae bacterium]|jgi:methionyl-tRNA formyltransferase
MTLRVVFLGSDPIALPLLEWLAGEGGAQAKLVAVYTQPDRPAGRGQKVRPNAVKTWALAKGIPVFQPEKITEEVRLQLAALESDLGLVMAYGHILRDAVIATPRLGMLNFHASLLPAYRGASPIQTAIAQGERETGVSLMRMVRELDAGPVADVERVPIGARDTALDIEAKLAASCVPLLRRAMTGIASGTLSFREQDRSLATFCRKLAKEDGVLDFSEQANALAARVKGLFPWPACGVEIAGQLVKVGLADAVGGTAPAGAQPGAILGTDAGGLLVATGGGILRLLKMQRPGGKMLPVIEFLRGFPIMAGTLLPSHPMPVLVAPQPFRRS